MTRRLLQLTIAALCLLLGAVSVGCAPSPPSAEPAPSRAHAEGVAAQECSVRLHDLCAELLLYSARNKLLPWDLTELPGISHSPACPASREPYLYNPAGWPVGKVGEHVIVCDARPTHLGTRLGIVVAPSEPGQPLVLKVASLPRGFEPE